MKKVDKTILISPTNQKIECYYWELENICKDICNKKENYDKFIEFKKDYTYFNPYFDFVMFELKYIFSNALGEENLTLITKDNALYGVDSKYCENIDYKTLYSLDKQDLYMIPIMTKCSDIELGIKSFDSKIKASMIDSNGMCMMSHTGIPSYERGSHIVTCRTILNQLLIQNNKIVEHYTNSIGSPIDYLVTNYGFIRATSKVEGGLAIGNKNSVSDSTFNKIANTKGFKFVDNKDSTYEKLTDEYLNRGR